MSDLMSVKQEPHHSAVLDDSAGKTDLNKANDIADAGKTPPTTIRLIMGQHGPRIWTGCGDLPAAFREAGEVIHTYMLIRSEAVETKGDSK